jgi:hypothetical protein
VAFRNSITTAHHHTPERLRHNTTRRQRRALAGLALVGATIFGMGAARLHHEAANTPTLQNSSSTDTNVGGQHARLTAGERQSLDPAYQPLNVGVILEKSINHDLLADPLSFGMAGSGVAYIGIAGAIAGMTIRRNERHKVHEAAKRDQAVKTNTLPPSGMDTLQGLIYNVPRQAPPPYRPPASRADPYAEAVARIGLPATTSPRAVLDTIKASFDAPTPFAEPIPLPALGDVQV